ncbi:hypothetical protein CDL12_13175 [Handroanthus impetiginosus]|uniref:Uncharacterized protein n=1 Tax=Handroanthus impetiginosus TaxID=429701 RepID=A0A2G9H9K7_9LAMI|nr:hypothetical protein CDL12_13175 [Handroanthus impetiginosus]
MVIQKLEMGLGLLKLAIQLVVVFVEAVGSVINQSNSAVSENPNYAVPVPYMGILS